MGLNFQTCTIINSVHDVDSSNAVKKVALFEGVETKVDGEMKKALKVKRDFLFVKDNIKAIRMRAGYPAMACKATIDFSELLDNILPEKGNNYCRLDMYVKYEGAEPFYGANPMHVQKGIPFWVEFTVKSSDSAAQIAKNIEKQIKKDHLFLIDKDIINVSVDGTMLVLEGATEYQRFDKINLHMFQISDEGSELVSELGGEGIREVVRGYNSFGTYSQIVKDLRLPTAANYQWTHIRQSETPIIDAVYDQYIIEYCAPASNEGTQFVGHRGNSWTTHVFWVIKNDEVQTAWKQALIDAGIEESEIEVICCAGEYQPSESAKPVEPETPADPEEGDEN